MAGLSKITADDDDECFGLENITREKLTKTRSCVDLKLGPNKLFKNNEEELRGLFVEIASLFFKGLFGNFATRPVPPMLGDRENVDLLKLFSAVKERGGYGEVSKTGSWQLLAKECGFDSSVIPGLKLVYVKYLDLLDRWVERTLNKEDDSKDGVNEKLSNFDSVSLELDSGFKRLLRDILEKKKKKDWECLSEEVKSDLDFEDNLKLHNSKEHCGALGPKLGMSNVEDDSVVEDNTNEGFESVAINRSPDINDLRSINNISVANVKDDDAASELSTVKENESCRKRKRECYLRMLKWIREVAKDPCDHTLGLLPEKSKWRSYGNEHLWKQVLLVREAMFLKKDASSSAQQSFWQNKLMHPALYEDSVIRCSQRVASAKDPRSRSRRRIGPQSSSSNIKEDLSDSEFDSNKDSSDDLWFNSSPEKPVKVGNKSQAYVPEWNGKTEESDPKWLGSRIWPFERREQNKHFIERERIGKGRQDTCGCQFPGSIECVRFHVSEKRKRVKDELGPAFYEWKFDNMGEEVALSWTREEKQKFQDTVKSNPFSHGKRFWEELRKAFPRKSRSTLVSYYFNVFLLQRRGYQNRTSPSKVDSDDDEADLGSEAVKHPPGSIFCSPKKKTVYY